jgi:creatinine amidohydrolase
MTPEDEQRQDALFAARDGAPLWPAGQGPERRLEWLRPRQFHALRRECPVLYVPLGTIEWHERHMPLGNDALKAHGLCLRVAEQVGGIVHPPLYWGVDTWRKSATRQVRRGMDSVADFALPGSVFQIQDATFQALLEDVVAEGLSAGFRLIVLCTGHNSPVQEHIVHQVAHDYNAEAGRTVVYPTNDWENARPQIPWAGDHAGQWETAVQMALHPAAVDMAELPPLPEPLVATGGIDPRKEASATLGQNGIEVMVNTLAGIIREILEANGQSVR